VKFVVDAVAKETFVAKKLVEVILVPLAFVKAIPLAKRLVEVAFTRVRLVPEAVLKVV
jgi:hypothetical protein